jgi:hypothetical protein
MMIARSGPEAPPDSRDLQDYRVGLIRVESSANLRVRLIADDFLQAPHGKPSLEWKRRHVWRHHDRNDFVSKIARATLFGLEADLTDDVGPLEGLWDANRPLTPLHVLVENEEHAEQLQGRFRWRINRRPDVEHPRIGRCHISQILACRPEPGFALMRSPCR